MIKLQKLEVENFKSYQGKWDFDLSSDFVLLCGKNGAGKTSFFEAIYIALNGRSFTNLSLSSLITKGENKGQIALEFIREENGEHAHYKIVRQFKKTGSNSVLLYKNGKLVADSPSSVELILKGLFPSGDRLKMHFLKDISLKDFLISIINFEKFITKAQAEFKKDEALRTKLLTEITSEQQISQTMLNKLNEIEQQLTLLKQEKEEIEKQLHNLQEIYTETQLKEIEEKQRKIYNAMLSFLSEVYTSYMTESGKLNSESEMLTKEIENLKEKIDEINSKKEEKIKLFAEEVNSFILEKILSTQKLLEEFLKENEEWIKKDHSLTEKESSIRKSFLEKKKEIEKQFIQLKEKLKGELLRNQEKIKELQKKIETVNFISVCPECTREFLVEEKNKIITKLNQELKTLESETERLQKDLEELNQKELNTLQSLSHEESSVLNEIEREKSIVKDKVQTISNQKKILEDKISYLKEIKKNFELELKHIKTLSEFESKMEIFLKNIVSSFKQEDDNILLSFLLSSFQEIKDELYKQDERFMQLNNELKEKLNRKAEIEDKKEKEKHKIERVVFFIEKLKNNPYCEEAKTVYKRMYERNLLKEPVEEFEKFYYINTAVERKKKEERQILEEKLKGKAELIELTTRQLVELQREYETRAQSLVQKEKEFREIEDRLLILSKFSNTRKLKKFIYNKIAFFVNENLKRMNNIIQIDLDVDDKGDVMIYAVNSNGVKVPENFLSAGEKVMMKLSLYVTLLKVTAGIADTSEKDFNYLFIDETLDKLDENNLRMVLSFLKGIKKFFNVFVISHRKEVIFDKEYFDDIIDLDENKNLIKDWNEERKFDYILSFQ